MGHAKQTLMEQTMGKDFTRFFDEELTPEQLQERADEQYDVEVARAADHALDEKI